jgi:HEAT repeat protein
MALLAAAGVGRPAPVAAARADGQQQLSFEDVVANLKVGDPRVKLDALKLLGQAGYLEAASTVAPLLADPTAEVQLATIDTLLSLYLVDETYTREYGTSIVKDKNASLALLAFAQGPGQLVANQFPPEVVRGLVACLASTVTEVRFNAAYALGVFGPLAAKRGAVPDGKVAVERLTGLAKDANPLLRLAGTQVLGRLLEAVLRNDKPNADVLTARAAAGDQVIAGMNDPDQFVRLASLRAVGEMRHERAVQSLMDFYGYYKSGSPAFESLRALGRIAHPGSLSLLAATLGAKDEQFRAEAAAGIGRSGDKSAIYNMESTLAREKSGLVKLALAFSKARNGEVAQVVTIAEGFAKKKTAPAAFDYLVELGPPIADPLAPIASHKNGDVRAGIAEVLGIIGNQQSAFFVQSLSRDKNKAVAAAGLRSAKRLSPRPANAPRLM